MMINKRIRSPRRGRTLRGVMREMLGSLRSPAEVLELYYWSQEPSLLKIMRAVVAMPESARLPLEAFVNVADPSKVTVTVDPDGRLTLASEEVTGAVELLKETWAVAESEGKLKH